MATIGRGIIELVADATQLKAGISDAKSSLNTLRDAAKSAGETLNAQGIKYIRTLEKQDARLKTQAATFGEGKSGIAAYGAAQLGVAQTADALVKSIAASEAAIKSKAKADRDATAAAQKLDAQQQSFQHDLQKKVDVGSGKLPSELAAIKAAQLGLTAQSGPLIAALALQEKGLGNIATNARLARFQSQQLGFQLHDFFIQLQAGQNPLTAFLQQGSQLSGTFGGAGPAFKAVLGLITPLRVALAGAATAVTGLGVAMYQGAQQSKEYADALVLSGNFAGQTAATVNTAVKSISASGEISRGAAREAVAAITATGEIGPKAFNASAEAAARFAQATGKSVKEVAADFATLGRDVTTGATKLNQSLNFLSAAQLQQIRNLQESGQQTEAYSIVIDALNTRLRSLEPNLGSLDKALRFTTNTWSKFWDAAFDIGRPDTIDEKVDKARAALERAKNPPIGARIDSALDLFGVNKKPNEQAEKQDQFNDALREQVFGRLNAAATAEAAALSKSTAEIRTRRDAQLDATKTDEARTKALKKLTDEFAQLDKEGRGFSPKQKQILIEDEKRKFEPPKGPRGSRPRVDREPEEVRKVLLDAALDSFKGQLAEERDTIAFHQRQVQALYQAGNISLREYYDTRNLEVAKGVQAEKNQLEKEQAELRKNIADPLVQKNPSERIKLEAQLAESIKKSGQVAVKAAQDATLANLEEAASFKQLAESVANFRADLRLMQGDEIGAARIRADQAIEQAKELARRSQDAPKVADRITPEQLASKVTLIKQDVILQETLLETGRITQRLSIDEERIALRAQTGILSENGALIAQGEARRKVIGMLAEQLAAQEKVAAAQRLEGTENPQLLINIERTRLELEKLAAALDPLKDKFNDLFRDAAGGAINDFISGTKSAKDALRGFGRSILNELTAISSKDLARQLFGQAGVLSGAGGIFADLFAGEKQGSEQSSLAGLFKTAPVPTIDTSAVTASLTTLATAGIDPTVAAFARLQQALAAQAMDRAPGAIQTTGDLARFDRAQAGESSIAELFKEPTEQAGELGAALVDTRTSAEKLAVFLPSVGTALGQVGKQGGAASAALSLLPSIISAISASSGAKAGGDAFGSFLSLFSGGGGGGSSAAEAAELAALFLHTGGVVGKDGSRRPVPVSVFAKASRYHEGGSVGASAVASPAASIAPAAALAVNEVPAILMGGPKGTREEVLHASDPRHADNIAPTLLQALKGGVGGDAIAKAIGGLGGEGGRAVGGIGGPGGDATITQIKESIASTNAGPIGAVTPRAPKTEAPRHVRVLHDGGIVGKAGKQRSIPVNVFAQAIKYHDGGIVGQRTDLRGIPVNVFVDAPKYHEGGVAGAPGAPGGSASAIGGVGGPGGASAGQTIVGLTAVGGLGGDGVGGKGGDAAGGLGGKGGDAGNIFVGAAQQIIVPALKMIQGAAGIGGEAIAKAIGGLGGPGGNAIARSVGGIGGLGGPGGASIGGQGIGGHAFAIGGPGGLGGSAVGGPGGRAIGGNAFAAGGQGGNAVGGVAFATAGQQMARQILTTIAGAPGSKGGDGGPGGLVSAIGGKGGVGGIGGIGGNAIGGHASVGRVQNLYTAPESTYVADALSSPLSIQNFYAAQSAAQIPGKATASAVALGGAGGATGAPGRAFAEGGRATAFGAPGADGVPGLAGSSALASVLRESRDRTSSLIDRASESSREFVSAFILAGRATPEIAAQGAPVVSVAALFAGTPGAAGVAGLAGLGGAAGVTGVPGVGGLGGTAGAGGLGGAAGRAGLAGSGGIGGAAGSAGLGGAAGAPGAIFYLGQPVATQPAQISMFADAPHDLIKGASVPQKTQIPAILLKNEEGLTRNDPRHRANIALLKTIEGAPGGIGGAGGLGGIGGNMQALAVKMQAPASAPASITATGGPGGIGGNAFSVGGPGGIGGNARGGDAFAGSAQMARQILTTIAGAPGGKGGDAITAARESSSLMRTLVGPTNLISELRKETVNTERFENSTIREIRETGARALGGPVTAGGMYRVNERGPEVLTMAGRQYMMPAQDGKVTQTEGGSDQRPINVSQTFVIDQPASKATQTQVATAALRGAQRALARGGA